MWRDVSKSTFWFCFGSLFSCLLAFTKRVNFKSNCSLSMLSLFIIVAHSSAVLWKLLRCSRAGWFSIFSAWSQLAILLLAISFFSNLVSQRYSFTFSYYDIPSYRYIGFGCTQRICFYLSSETRLRKGLIPRWNEMTFYALQNWFFLH